MQLEITGIADDAAKEDIQEKLRGMTDVAGTHTMSYWDSGDKWHATLAPVSDPEAFAKRIDFDEVTSIEGGTVKVTVK
ncbi:MAG: hypothetical protein PVH68_20430 [Armatimonadota bacterium]